MAGMDEFALIRMLTSAAGRPGEERAAETARGDGVRVGIGDDAAVVGVRPGMELVLTCDTMVEGVHFKAETMKPEDVGYKALASNVSDMAAMGAMPRYALVSISVPMQVSEGWLTLVYRGIYECADEYGVAIVGGDTTSSLSGFVISITLIGEAEAGRALLRSSAEQGDLVFVTGELGGSAAGLHWLLQHGIDASRIGESAALTAEVEELIHCHQRPVPEVELGRLLLKSGARIALNDVSDGLASEAWELAEASGVSLVLYEDKLPAAKALLHYAAEVGRNPLDWILYGGEDYRLVGTISRDRAEELSQLFAANGRALYVIGEVASGLPGVRLLSKNGGSTDIDKRGYNHFK
jgi:thiamine-monophosphate kinase